ncbi:TRAP transporter small permease [Tepidamorphus sp. 3E244]|uniref:TRAP transporter small permease n=1 Tax=Tepidamorphus sp. 3E244 TaxID=3385498 RepID=UPI0038FD246E
MHVILKVVEWAVIALMAVIALLVITEVLVRDLFDLSIGIHEELTRYLMIWVAMLGSVLLTHENSHVRISMLPDMLTGRSALIVECLADLVIIFFLAAFFYASALNLPSIIGQDTVTLGVGMVWFHAALPVGGALMLLIAAIQFASRLRRLAAGD